MGPAGITVRRLREGDARSVAELAGDLRRYFSPADLRAIADLLEQRPSGLLALDEGGRVLGFLLDAPTDDPRVREIAWMGVAEPYQRRGIGSLLLRTLADALAAAGYTAVEVSTVAESAGYAPYEATRTFYHLRGFVDVRIDPDYYWPGGDRLLLRRAVPPGTPP